VKLGGSVITDKQRRFSVRLKTLRRIAKELAAVKEPMIIVHGGGSFGHPIASKYDIAKGYLYKRQLMGFSLTHRAMEELNGYVVDALKEAGIPAMSVQPSACTVVRNGRIVSMELAPIRKLLELGITPVLYGDVVPDLNRGMSILSGDQLVMYLAQKLRASRVILGVDVDGFYTADPKSYKGAKLIREITPENWRDLAKSASTNKVRDVTGGMSKKIEELLPLAKLGVEAEIINATKPGILRRAVLGERGLGTRIIMR
jgi:isopentenyl phosphate kinase